MLYKAVAYGVHMITEQLHVEKKKYVLAKPNGSKKEKWWKFYMMYHQGKYPEKKTVQDEKGVVKILSPRIALEKCQGTPSTTITNLGSEQWGW